MTKLHQLLAVIDNLKGQATKTRSDLMATFKSKRHLFEGRRKTFTSSSETDTQPVIEERQDIQSTVPDEIQWISKHLAKAMDVSYQVDKANMGAFADVIVEGSAEALLKAIPATTLLQLEKRIGEVKELIDSIPTLDPAKGFAPDSSSGSGHFVAREVTKIRTKKGKKLYVKYDATDKHPAQTELIDEDIPVGTIKEQEWSALITPAKKGELIDQCEMLHRAVTKARSKANEHEIDPKDQSIGKTLLDFVFKPLEN